MTRHGPNELEDVSPPSALAIFLNQFRSPLIYIVLLAAAVTAALREWLDTGVIGAALNAVIGFVQERRAALSVRALMRVLSPHARAIRGGREHEIESRALVRGDFVVLESGVRVPAGLRLVCTTLLPADESLLTGESTPVMKSALPSSAEDVPLSDRACMAYAGRRRGAHARAPGRVRRGDVAVRTMTAW